MIRFKATWINPNAIGGSDAFFDVRDPSDIKEIRDAIAAVPRLMDDLTRVGCRQPAFDPAQYGMHVYDMDTADLWMRVEQVRHTDYVDKAVARVPLKKVLTDRCPRCGRAGTWGARACLKCPACNIVIGGL